MENVTNVLIKSHPKSIIQAVLVGSKNFSNLFENSVPTAEIYGSICSVIVLQVLPYNNYVIVEYVREDEYTEE